MALDQPVKAKKNLTVENTTQNYLQDDSVLTVPLANPEQEAATLCEEDASQYLMPSVS